MTMPETVTSALPLLRVRGLSKRYPTGATALSDVNLDVPAGQVLALIGPSGAGKSTLIRCVNRLVEPSSGELSLAGRSLAGLGRRGLREARRQLGMIFQEYALVERLTVMENVLSGRLGYTGFWRSWLRRFSGEDVAQAYAFLERVGLSGYENQRADALSGGQRQRVGIARALMQDPLLLLVDEPTASLDPRTSRHVMRLLCELCRERGLSAIVNIHDVALATRFADRIVGLQKGRIVYDGAPAGLGAAALTAIYGEEDWNAPGTTDAGQTEPPPESVPSVSALPAARPAVSYSRAPAT
ncbi:phosphonate ABC transporter ATP-binding protein [Verticiella alkaliphila]|uniref:phosphonate ABC transporter ATP-binding protein n=1 Tax=Verticiella alkaliphila TaxID=2779529 RepID=UPI00209B29EF|nr:phosphonate ABC transporter ATP-binding protein [Verticiella sp. GG226]